MYADRFQMPLDRDRVVHGVVFRGVRLVRGREMRAVRLRGGRTRGIPGNDLTLMLGAENPVAHLAVSEATVPATMTGAVIQIMDKFGKK